MNDPTYVQAEIDANPVWELAFALSEIRNDSAPLGWGKYIFTAKCLLANFNISRKEFMKRAATASGEAATPPPSEG